MPAQMNALRRARRLATFVLVWFALYLGVALAAHAFERLEMGCSAGGMKLLLVDNQGVADPATQQLKDCRLCVLADAPPPACAPILPTARNVAPAQRPIALVAIAAATPFSARAPPLA
jgi:hypothetical protein